MFFRGRLNSARLAWLALAPCLVAASACKTSGSSDVKGVNDYSTEDSLNVVAEEGFNFVSTSATQKTGAFASWFSRNSDPGVQTCTFKAWPNQGYLITTVKVDAKNAKGAFSLDAILPWTADPLKEGWTYTGGESPQSQWTYSSGVLRASYQDSDNFYVLSVGVDPKLSQVSFVKFISVPLSAKQQAGASLDFPTDKVNALANCSGGFVNTTRTSRDERNAVYVANAEAADPGPVGVQSPVATVKLLAASRSDVCFWNGTDPVGCYGQGRQGIGRQQSLPDQTPVALGVDDGVPLLVQQSAQNPATLTLTRASRVVGPVANFKDVVGGLSWYCVQQTGPDQIHCSGDNNYGHGSNIDDVPALTAPAQLSAGESHACVLDQGQPKCWGSTGYGYGSKPSDIPALKHPVLVRAQSQKACAVHDDGVRCWGNHWYLTAGLLDYSAKFQKPTDMWVGGGDTDSVCVVDDGDLKCFGHYFKAFKKVTDYFSQNKVKVSKIVGGESFFCAATSTMGLQCFGSITTSSLVEAFADKKS